MKFTIGIKDSLKFTEINVEASYFGADENFIIFCNDNGYTIAIFKKDEVLFIKPFEEKMVKEFLPVVEADEKKRIERKRGGRMTKIEELRQEFNDRLDKLEKELKQEETKTPLGWTPEVGENYYFVNVGGGILAEIDTDFGFDREVIECTRVFKTRAEAEFEAERMKVIRELEKFSKEFVKDERDWFIAWDYVEEEINFHDYYTMKFDILYFESEEKTKEAIESVGAERVKKYYLGVE